MKKFKTKYLLLLILAFSLVSCLKDSDFDNGINGIKGGDNNFVEVRLTALTSSNVASASYEALTHDSTINMVPIHLTSIATEDVTVTFELLDTLNSATNPDAAIMKKYVDSANYRIPPVDSFTIVNQNMQVKIPKGSNTGYIQAKFTPANLIGSTFIFGIRIKSISGTTYKLSNLITGFLKFGVKNAIDGQYEVNGDFIDYLSAIYTGYYPRSINLITQDANSNAYFDVVSGNYRHLMWKDGTTASYFGNFCPVFVFDADFNVIAVKNYYTGLASGGQNRTAEIDNTTSGVINKFDPVTKTLKVTYWMNEDGVLRTHFDETFTYIGPR